MIFRDRAICTRTVDYSETSQVVTFFTRRHGKISGIARGAKRKKSAFDGPIEVFSRGEVLLSTGKEANLATVREFEQRQGYGQLTRDFLALNSALFAIELVNSFTDEYDPHEALFESMEGFLENLSETQNREDILKLLILFQLSLLREIGLGPVLDRCVNCGKTFSTNWSDIYFSSSANGLICRDCEGSFPEKLRLSRASGQCLTKIGNIGQAKTRQLRQIEELLVHHFREKLGRNLRMARYVLSYNNFS